jgi:hypothetical protein
MFACQVVCIAAKVWSICVVVTALHWFAQVSELLGAQKYMSGANPAMPMLLTFTTWLFESKIWLPLVCSGNAVVPALTVASIVTMLMMNSALMHIASGFAIFRRCIECNVFPKMFVFKLSLSLPEFETCYRLYLFYGFLKSPLNVSCQVDFA